MWRSLPFLPLALVQHGPTLAGLVAWHAQYRPDALAAAQGDIRLTYRQLWQKAERLATLIAAHPTPPRRIGLCSSNSVHFLIALLSAQRLGLDVTALAPHVSPAQVRGLKLDWLLTDSGPYERTDVRCVSLDALLAHPGCWPPDPLRQPKRAPLQLLTSGTSAPPRLLDRSHAAAEQCPAFLSLLRHLPLRPQMPLLLPLPLYHGHGLSVLALGLALGSPIFFSREVAEQWHILHREKIELLTLVPTQLFRLLEDWQGRPPALRAILCGSGPLSADLATRALSHFGPVLHNLYGTTETGLIAHACPAELLRAPGSVGRVLPGVRVRIVDDEVCVLRGTRLLATGDMGQVQGDLLRLHGRKDDVIVRGGECLYPEWLEAKLRHPGLSECAVVGIPDPEYGQAIHVFAVRAAGSMTDANDLLRDWQARLPRTLRPERVTFLPALPRNALGKLLRRELRTLLASTINDDAARIQTD